MASFHLHIKSGGKGQALNHAKYILREGKFSNSGKASDLMKTGFGGFPEWASESPSRFWKAADKGERANGSTYREFELALPSELSLEQNTELLEKFIEKAIPGKPFQYAIHAPTASIGNTNQPHAHLMYNDRKPDDIDRLPEQYFRRYNAVNPELGGAKKDSGGKDRQSVKEDLVNTRQLWADLQNQKFEELGIEARVDHRSYRERGIDKIPEKHLGFGGVMALSDDELSAMNLRRKGDSNQV